MPPKFYRVVNPSAEKVGQVIDTSTLLPSPKVQKTLLYNELWKEVVNFWSLNNCQLITPCHVIVKYNNIFGIADLENLANNLLQNNITTFKGNLLYSQETAAIDTQSFLTLLSVVKTYTLSEPIWIIWEYLWEDYRQKNMQGKPSRMESVFLFDDIHNAQDFYQMQRADNPNLQLHEVNIIQSRVLDFFDMSWIDDLPLETTYNNFMAIASNYWQQKRTAKPINELLFQGTYELI